MPKRGKKSHKFFLILLIFLIVFFTGGIAAVKYIFPRDYETYVTKYSKMYELDPALVNAIIKTESSFNRLAVSPKNAKGLMQITDQTGEWAAAELGIDFFDSEQLFDPETNILIGCWYLRKLMNQYENNLELVLSAYNAGSGNVSRWLRNSEYSNDGQTLFKIPFKETESYLMKVKYTRQVYKILDKIKL